MAVAAGAVGLTFVDVYGMVGTTLGIMQFGINNFGPLFPDPPAATIRIQVGLESPNTGIFNAGGDLPVIRTFNEAGQILGMNPNTGEVEQGSFKDIKVDQDNKQQPVHTLFSAKDDAICIALATIVWPDGQKYAWTGGFARLCGLSWSYSDIVVSAANSGGEKLDCMWIDADGNQPYTGFQVYWPAYGAEAAGAPHKSKETFCNDSSVFSVKTDQDPRFVYKTPTPKIRRRHQHHSSSHQSSLIVSNDPAQCAIQLCESPSSWGPDFLNIHQGWFCQTIQKKLYPICNATVLTDCFNANTTQLVRGLVSARDQVYRRIIDWTHGAWKRS